MPPRPRECAAPPRAAARARLSRRVAARDASPPGRSEPRPASPPGPPHRRPRPATGSWPRSQRLERGEHVGPVEQADVLRLRQRQPAHGPREVYEVRLEGRAQRLHPRLLGQQVPLARVAARARREHVGPRVRPAPRQRHQVIPRQALPRPEVALGATAKLAAVVVTGEEEGVGDLAAEAAGDVYELHETDDCWSRQLQPLTADRLPLRLDDLRLVVDHETQRPAHGHHRQGLERGIEGKAAQGSLPAKKRPSRSSRPRRPRMLHSRVTLGKSEGYPAPPSVNALRSSSSCCATDWRAEPPGVARPSIESSQVPSCATAAPSAGGMAAATAGGTRSNGTPPRSASSTRRPPRPWRPPTG